jgi:hypothetical protein
MKGSIKNEVTDVGLFTSELGWLVKGIDLVQFGVTFN